MNVILIVQVLSLAVLLHFGPVLATMMIRSTAIHWTNFALVSCAATAFIAVTWLI
jgi:hypothetical protein